VVEEAKRYPLFRIGKLEWNDKLAKKQVPLPDLKA
jgi:hypothetical protein